MSQNSYRKALWIAIFVVLVLVAAQGWAGNWSVFYLVWPGSNLSGPVPVVTAHMAAYHIKMGFAIGGLAILIIVLAFLAKSSLYVKAFAFLGLVVSAVAALGGYAFVTSAFDDRLSLGQMADAFLGVFASYFFMLFFLNKTPKFPWSKARAA